MNALRLAVVAALLWPGPGRTDPGPSSPAVTPAPARPSALSYPLAVPGDLVTFVKEVPRWGGGWGVPAIAVATGVLFTVDGRLYEGTARLGRRAGIAQNNAHVTYGHLPLPGIGHPVSILELPTNVGSAMYFLGNGWFSGGIWAGFLAGGLIADDTRALATAGQLCEAIVGTGLTGLTIKMSTGHEDPGVRTSRNGRWRFFRSPVVYLRNVTHYDAFPTGHLATLMTTTTVIAENYPDQCWIRPLGYTLMGALGFQMVNSGVHWFGDYPVGIAIGYAYAEITVRRARAVSGSPSVMRPDVAPLLLADGTAGLCLEWRIARP